MRKSIQNVLSAVAPVLGVTLAMAVMRGTGRGFFPPSLAWEDWAVWVIFAALVYCVTSLANGAARWIGGAPRASGDASAAPQSGGGSHHPAG